MVAVEVAQLYWFVKLCAGKIAGKAAQILRAARQDGLA